MEQEDISKFYRNTVNVIYGVIIGLSFTQVGTLFTPLSRLNQFEYQIDAFAAMFAYFFIITSWIGYHRSITSNPHRGKVGNMRFAVDLFIVFLSYYLVNLASTQSNREVQPLANYSDTFVWIMPTMFFTFVVWDILKIIEYWDYEETRKMRRTRMLYSVIVGLIFLVMSFMYQTWGSEGQYNFYWILSSLVIVIFYRIFLKWPSTHDIKESQGNTSNAT